MTRILKCTIKLPDLFSTMEDKPRVATKSLHEVCFPGTLTVVSRVFILRLTSVCVRVCVRVCVWGGGISNNSLLFSLLSS